MPLKIELRPNERLIIGNALITNDKERINFYIEGDVPILREKFVMTAEHADTPFKRVYFIVQGMYLSKNPSELHDEYFTHIKDIIQAAPSLTGCIDDLNQLILRENYYGALKKTMDLIDQEDEMLKKAIENKNNS